MKINFLDHVAIRVKDLQKSADWYQKVLGLSGFKTEEWGDFPIFLLSGKTGVALFPASDKNTLETDSTSHIRIDHFALNVDKESFKDFQHHLKKLNIEFQFQDHHYFHSIYFKDLDDHQLELTTLVVDEYPFL